MKPGSIVILNEKIVRDEDIQYLLENKISLTPNTPYIVSDGPYPKVWRLIPFVIASIIRLEEYPGHEFNAWFFIEVQPPGEVKIEELISEPETCLI